MAASKPVKGEVPVLQPLQPAPENVKPNISNNIQYETIPAANQTDNSASAGFSAGNDNTTTQNAQAPSQLIAHTYSNKTLWVVALLLALLAVAGIIISRYQRKK